MYRTVRSKWVLCRRVSFFYVFNIVLLSLPNITHPIVALDRSVVGALFVHLYTIPSSTQSASLSFSFFIPPLYLLPIITQALENGFLFVIRDLNDDGWRWRWDYQPVCEWSRSGQCPYTTRVCDITLGDSFFARCSLLSLVIDHPFLYCSSFTYSFPNTFWTFSCCIPRLSPSRKPSLSNQWLFNVIQVILTQYFCLLRRFESSNLCTCVRTGSAWCMHLHYWPLLLTLCQHQALPGSWWWLWWSDDVGLWFYFDTGDTMPRHCESKHGTNEFVQILYS